ncbi:hypothetical protein ACFO4E_08515 [Nocardiopsis mangrovi]|uniref:PQQ-binding-like beta-propeller repeat protein n=1 Tax=Nocardiopsis mangrovi TaxID=1179818 RepID=A0ABV9DU12_9ACTN
MPVILSDGMVALDTRSGRELWHYRRPGGSVASHVADQGAVVLIAYEAEPTGVTEGVLLDTATGEPVDDTTGTTGLPLPADIHNFGYAGWDEMTVDGGVLHRFPDDDIVATVSDPGIGGDARWEYPRVEGCATGNRQIRGPDQFEVAGDTAVVSLLCGGDIDGPPAQQDPDEHTGVLIGNDIASGEELWRVDDHAEPAIAIDDE